MTAAPDMIAARETAALVTVVMITRNRCAELLGVLDRLAALPDAAPVIVVDNGSDDGTADAVTRAHPGTEVIRAGRNRAAAGRNLGAVAASTPFVAFCDDDAWWAPGALSRAASHLASDERLGAVTARILVEPGGRVDPTSTAMARSPLPARAGQPGPRVVGFLAAGVMVRRSAFLAAGGFCERYGVGGEEELLALDLMAAGWDLCHADDVVVHHQPSPSRAPAGVRQRTEVRNRLRTYWLRYPLPAAVTATARVLRGGSPIRARAWGVVDVVGEAADIRRGRRRLPRHVMHDLELVRRSG